MKKEYQKVIEISIATEKENDIKKIPKLTNPEIQALRYKSMQYINSQIFSKINTY